MDMEVKTGSITSQLTKTKINSRRRVRISGPRASTSNSMAPKINDLDHYLSFASMMTCPIFQDHVAYHEPKHNEEIWNAISDYEPDSE
ncbi:hypothetical protein TCAL_15670 [Tigriopus californicus]|uniref:Uncharacterized protein n=1 Tax=Tigriopus californicus TaxID=6832 RepID=A0A553PA65_TIGCA|nr:hypothetical protein TCAL_15670 [Tigriopus californicus]